MACLSGWAALKDDLAERVKSGANAHTPAFVFHGTMDQTVLPECGATVKELLQTAGVPVTFGEHAMAHGSCPQEMAMMSDWASKALKVD